MGFVIKALKYTPEYFREVLSYYVVGVMMIQQTASMVLLQKATDREMCWGNCNQDWFDASEVLMRPLLQRSRPHEKLMNTRASRSTAAAYKICCRRVEEATRPAIDQRWSENAAACYSHIGQWWSEIAAACYRSVGE